MANDRLMPSHATPYRHILWLLFAGHLLSFADRVVFGLVLKPIKVGLTLSDSQAGLLVGTAFAIGYAVFAPLGGHIIDRRRRRPIFVFAVTFWSIATFSSALAGSFIVMAMARAAVGAGEALLHPLATSLIGDTAPAEKRAKVFATYFSAAAFGTCGVLLFGGALYQVLSRMPSLRLPWFGAIQPWQALFMSLVVPGLLLAAVALAFMKEPPRKTQALGTSKARETSLGAFILANPGIAVAIFIGYPVIQTASNTLMGWIFVFFDRVYGLPTGKIGVVFGLTSGVALIIGCYLGGQIIGSLRKRGYADASLRACILGGITFSGLAIAALMMPTPALALTFFAGAFLLALLPTIAAYAAISEIVPPAIRASASGISTLAVGMITQALGPFLVGYFSDHVYPSPTGIRWAMVTVVAISASGGTVLIASSLRSFRNRLAQGVEVANVTQVPAAREALGHG